MAKSRVARLNSLLKEVISEVIHRDIHHQPYINQSITITKVEITSDLSYAKVFVSILGADSDKIKALDQLNHLAPLIAVMSSKKVTMRYFPSLTFEIDHGLEKQLRIETLLSEISKERKIREHTDSDNSSK